YSDDGGQTWGTGGLLPTPGNDILNGQRYPQILGDPDVKYLGRCTFVYSSLMLNNSGAFLTQHISLHRSTDCGHTWRGRYEATAGTNPHGRVDTHGNGLDEADKDLMDVDPDTGRVIISWSNFTPFVPGQVEISVAYSANALTGNPPVWSTRRIVANAL